MKSKTRQRKNTVTPDKVASYNLHMQGLTQKEIGNKYNVSNVTVSRWIKQVNEYMQQSPQYQDALPDIASMIPQAVETYRHHLKLHNDKVATNVFKMTGLMIDRLHTENTDNKARLTDSELKQALKELTDECN